MSRKTSKQNRTPSNALIAQMRERGSMRSSIWHVYSFKVDRDLILESHRELAHWLLYLEFNPSIVEFWKPHGEEFNGNQRGGRKVKLDVIAKNAQGRVEWHEVKPNYVDDPNSSEQLRTQRELAVAAGAIYRLFDESTRDTCHYKVMPLLRLMTFVSLARRLKRIERLEPMLLQHVHQEVEGTLQSLCLAFPDASPSELVAGVSRLAIRGQVELTIDQFTPALHTQWALARRLP